MSERTPAVTTAGGKERIHQAAVAQQKCFLEDPSFTYFLNHMSDERRHAYLLTLFTRFFTACAMNKAVFEEADSWSSSTVILPPGKHLDNPLTIFPSGLWLLLFEMGPRHLMRMLFEFGGIMDKSKRKGMPGIKRYWYVFFIGTDPAKQGKGLGTQLLEKVKDRARADGVPAWIESTTADSCRLYQRCGFELVEEVRLGTGVAGADGRPKKGGEGVPMWTLVWWPQKHEE